MPDGENGKMGDLISIIVPAYNMEKYLGKCLDSIIKQTYSRLEIVVIDDGSMDNTLSVAQGYAQGDNRIKIIQQENQGVSKARNRGLEEIKGKYIQFIDADDYVADDMIEVLYQGFEEPGTDVTICNFSIRGNGVKGIEHKNQAVIYEKSEACRQLFLRSSFQGFTCNKMFSTEIIKKNQIKFTEGIFVCEDLLFCMEYFSFIKKAVYTPQMLYFYEVREDSVTAGSRLNVKRYSVLDVYKTIEVSQMAESAEDVRVAIYNHMATNCILLVKMTLKYRQKCLRKIFACLNKTGWYYLKSEWQVKFKAAYIPLKIVSCFYK